MKRTSKYIILRKLFIAFVCMIAASGRAVSEKTDQSPFKDCLVELGERFDCYFTVESWGAPGYQNNQIINANVSIDVDNIKDIDDVLSFLNNGVDLVLSNSGEINRTSLVAEKFECSKTIIMIRDKRLLRVTNYALANNMSVAYEGTPLGLEDFLSAKEPLIQRHRSFTRSMSSHHDNTTQIEVNATNVCTRNIMTSCIPLEGYNRIIWSSYTDGKDDSPVIRTEYYGAKPVSTQTFRDCLVELGNRLDCYFTVESIGSSPLLDMRVSAKFAEVRDVDSAMDFLTNKVVWASSGTAHKIQLVVEKLEGEKTILLIRDSRLKRGEDYALSKTMSLDYEGTLGGFLELLSKKDPQIGQQTIYTLATVRAGNVNNDLISKVKVFKTDTILREALATCISLEGYSRVVWSSIKDGGQYPPSIKIGFYGKNKENKGGSPKAPIKTGRE